MIIILKKNIPSHSKKTLTFINFFILLIFSIVIYIINLIQ